VQPQDNNALLEEYTFFFNQQILLNVILARRKVWTKQDTNGAAYIRYTITTKQSP